MLWATATKCDKVCVGRRVGWMAGSNKHKTVTQMTVVHLPCETKSQHLNYININVMKVTYECQVTSCHVTSNCNPVKNILILTWNMIFSKPNQTVVLPKWLWLFDNINNVLTMCFYPDDCCSPHTDAKACLVHLLQTPRGCEKASILDDLGMRTGGYCLFLDTMI